MRYLRLSLRIVHGVSETVGRAASWLAPLLVAVVCFDVFTRYALRRSSVAVQELEWHLFALLFLLAAAYTLKHDRHVRVDVLYMRLSDRGRAMVNLAGILVFLLPLCVILIGTSWAYVANSFAIGETSPDPGGLPFRYLPKAAIPLGYALVLLQGLAMAVESVLFLAGGREEPEAGG